MEQSEIKQLIVSLSEVYGRNVPPSLITAYHDIFANVSLERVRIAYRRMLAERPYGSIPIPAELLKHLPPVHETTLLLEDKTPPDPEFNLKAAFCIEVIREYPGGRYAEIKHGAELNDKGFTWRKLFDEYKQTDTASAGVEDLAGIVGGKA